MRLPAAAWTSNEFGRRVAARAHVAQRDTHATVCSQPSANLTDIADAREISPNARFDARGVYASCSRACAHAVHACMRTRYQQCRFFEAPA
uniref:Apple domain-containing protein n=1 Tax=Ascaris lumbricoides TaxID=6252 RepID=A0A0M3HS95_ASCLU